MEQPNTTTQTVFGALDLKDTERTSGIMNLTIAFIGLVLMLAFLTVCFVAKQTDNWAKVPGTIISPEAGALAFRYQVNNRLYTGTKFSASPFNYPPRFIDNGIEGYPELSQNRQVTVYCNALNPSQSVIQHGVPGDCVMVTLGGLLLMIVGLVRYTGPGNLPPGGITTPSGDSMRVVHTGRYMFTQLKRR